MGTSDQAQTVTGYVANLPPPSAARPRLAPGDVLAGRYRIVVLLGRGGMGEVYRADDLVLEVPVALKFPPASLAADPAWLSRLQSEVRAARRVSHPNVCRVYDIAQAAGSAFIAMEYIDGEDLAGLLRRIGRLPPERAIEVARQLCLGLGAIHEQGLIHRDLKPQNVMIDGRGRVRIADFGIALDVDGAPQPAGWAGTPLYMAPEQLRGQPTTAASDIYALGLVLFELFTGRHAHVEKGSTASITELRRAHESLTGPEKMSSFVSDVDPAIGRAVSRCLSPDPADRPGSAFAVLASLPGGDPLKAALAAGEMPSPRLVAASGEKGVLSPLMATVLAVVALLAPLMHVAHTALSRHSHARGLADAKPPQVLEDRVTQIIGQLRPSAAKVDSWWSYAQEPDGQFSFSYRQAPAPIVAQPDGRVSNSNPAPERGDVFVSTTAGGALLYFQATHRSIGLPTTTAAQAQTLARRALELAEIDSPSLTAADPALLPARLSFDARLAFVANPGVTLPAGAVRVELAFAASELVQFRLLNEAELREPPNAPVAVTSRAEHVRGFAFTLVLIAVIGTGARNLYRGLADRRGTLRVALFAWACATLALLFAAHLPGGWLDPRMGILTMAKEASLSFLAGLGYAALEPLVRRRWPDLLVSWTRLLEGRLRDPLVGRDLLFGLAVSAVIHALDIVVLNPEVPKARQFLLTTVSDGVSNVLLALAMAAGVSVICGFTLALIATIVRRRWLALVIAGSFLASVVSLSLQPRGAAQVTAVLLGTLIQVALVWRFGLLAFAVMVAAGLWTTATFFYPSLGAWYAAASLPVLACWAGLIAYCWWISGRPAGLA